MIKYYLNWCFFKNQLFWNWFFNS